MIILVFISLLLFIYLEKVIELVNLDRKQSLLYDRLDDEVYTVEEYSSKVSIDESIYDEIEITFTSINESHFQMMDNLTDYSEYLELNIILQTDNSDSILSFSNMMFHLKKAGDEKSLIFKANNLNIYKFYDKFCSVFSQKNDNVYNLKMEIDLNKSSNDIFLSVSKDEYICSSNDYFEKMDMIMTHSYLNPEYVLKEMNESFQFSLIDVENYIESIRLVEKPSEYTSNTPKSKKLPLWMIVVIIVSSVIFLLLLILLIYGMYRNKKKVIIKIKRKRLNSYETKKKEKMDDNVILLNQNRKKKVNEKVNQAENDPFIPPPPQIDDDDDDDSKLPPLKPKNAWQ